MSGLRVLLLTSAAFAAICVLGFALLPEWQPAPVGEEVTVRPEPVAHPTAPPGPRAAPSRPAPVPTPSPESGPAPAAALEPPAPLIPRDAILEPPRRWEEDVWRSIQAPLERCLEDHGGRIKRPLTVAVKYAFDVSVPGKPHAREAEFSESDPYFQACVEDLLTELPLPDLGHPAGFEIKKEFVFTEGGPPAEGSPEEEE